MRAVEQNKEQQTTATTNSEVKAESVCTTYTSIHMWGCLVCPEINHRPIK